MRIAVIFFIFFYSVNSMAKDIVTIFDDNYSVLLQKAEDVSFQDESKEAEEITSALTEKFESMLPVSGLAAPQIGISKQAFIYSWDGTKENAEIVINPKITYSSSETIDNWEGCLSVIKGEKSEIVFMPRAAEIHAEYMDERGNLKRKILKRYTARIFLHESDHLQGKLSTEYNSAKIKEFNNT